MLLNFLTTSNTDASAGGIHIEPGRFVEMLPKLAIGMISIFLVIGLIIVSTYILNKIFSRKKNK